MTDDANTLGEYLRARRELVRPEDVGLPQLGQRRVPGLRREEVAMLAGISADYYLRLEQGRDRHPSVQVLESIARVLMLDASATEYLLGLGTDRPKRKRPRRREVVPVGVRKLIETVGLPAFVEGRCFDVLAANPLATAISPRLTAGRNRVRDVLLDPAEQALYPDPEVAGLRHLIGSDVDDPRAVELVGELSLASDRFRRLWARHDVVRWQGGATVTLNHPQVGTLVLNREKLGITGTGQLLVMYHPDARSHAAEKLALLASFSAPSPSAPARAAEARPAD